MSASMTMAAVCAARAAHAERLGDRWSARLTALMPQADALRRDLDEASRGMFTRSILVRSLWFGQLLEGEAAARAQLVVLSAGLDTRPLTLPAWRTKALFCVDHLESQQLCRQLLAAAEVDTSGARFVSLDLQAAGGSGLLRALAAGGADFDAPTLIVWEGATYYLSPEAVFDVLEAIGRGLRRARVAADFLNEDGYVGKAGVASHGVARNLSVIGGLGEPWIGYFSPRQLDERLRRAGFARVVLEDRARVEERLLGAAQMGAGKMLFMVADTGAER